MTVVVYTIPGAVDRYTYCRAFVSDGILRIEGDRYTEASYPLTSVLRWQEEQ